MYSRAKEKNPELVNLGKRWSKDEESLLLQHIKDNKSHLDISLEFKRTVGGVLSHLKEVAVKMYNKKEPLETIESLTGLNGDTILEAVEKHKAKAVSKKRDLKESVEAVVQVVEPVVQAVEPVVVEPVASTIKPVKLYALNETQELVMEELDKGHNIFTTGPGGTGKTFLINHICRILHAQGKKVAVTSLTGMAALLIGPGARTIHSWSGLGLGNRSVQDSFNFIRKCQKKVKEAWRETDVLIIDEISMMSCDFFSKLNELAQLLRYNKKPFGGIQLLCFGDFYQLPPINTEFVFESPLWNTVIDSIVLLDTIYRQKDPAFQKALNEIRIGKVSDATDALLKQRIGLDFSKEEIQPTKIFTRRDTVDRINKEGLDALEGTVLTYLATTVGKVSSDSIKNALTKMDANSQYVNKLELKVGAQVMLIANIDTEAGFVNGRLGIVKQLNTNTVTVCFKGGIIREIGRHEWKLENDEKISRSQIPLILAYAITIHKSQGSTLDSAYIDIGSSVFEYGQAYVALSRVKSLDALYLHAYSRYSIKAHPKVVEYYQSLG